MFSEEAAKVLGREVVASLDPSGATVSMLKLTRFA
jgi:hypothetical protein